jgi:hypothetical protein
VTRFVGGTRDFDGETEAAELQAAYGNISIRSAANVGKDNRRPADRVACGVKGGLFTEAELLEELRVFREVVALDVVEQLTTAGGHLEEAAAAVEVLAVGAEMLGQVIDASGQQGDLDLGGTGVFIVGFV